MAEATLNVTPYNGSVLSAQLLSADQTLVLSSFGAPQSGTLSDNDGLLSTADDGTATFNGQPVTYIGSGTAQPGVNVLGVTVPLGAAVPLVAFSVGGQIYFYYPEGPPNLLGAVAVVVSLDPVPYQVFTPVCFCAGTLIATPEGDRPIETLVAGDMVLDWRGKPEEIIWIGGRRMILPMGLASSYERWLPVKIPAGALGNGLPFRDLYLSQQHRLLISTPMAELLFGAPDVLTPAKALVGDRIRLQTECREVEYWHILCRRHTVLRAEGLPSESLFLGDVTAKNPAHAAVMETLELFPELQIRLKRARSSHPVLKVREGRLLAQALH